MAKDGGAAGLGHRGGVRMIGSQSMQDLPYCMPEGPSCHGAACRALWDVTTGHISGVVRHGHFGHPSPLT